MNIKKLHFPIASWIFWLKRYGVNWNSLLSQPPLHHPMASPFWSACVTPWYWAGNSLPPLAAPTSPATSWITARSSMECQGSGTRPTLGLSARGPTEWVSHFVILSSTLFYSVIHFVLWELWGKEFPSVSLSLQVSELKENRKYQFQVRAANMAGVGIPSLPSDVFLCAEWTIAVPGGLYQMHVTLKWHPNKNIDNALLQRVNHSDWVPGN